MTLSATVYADKHALATYRIQGERRHRDFERQESGENESVLYQLLKAEKERKNLLLGIL